jgi:hypothetical protein
LNNDKRVKKLLESISDLIKSIKPAEIHDSIETSSGVVNYTTTRKEPINQKISELEDIGKEFIKNWTENGGNIIRYYKPDFKQTNLSFEMLDSVFYEWLNDKNEEKFSSDSLANGLGVLFGELLSEKLKMYWVKVIDEYGEEYGVRTLDNFTSFPISSVYKRIKTEETGFFTNIYEMLKHTIDKKKDEI